MSFLLNFTASRSRPVIVRRSGLAAGLLAATLLGACAVPFGDAGQFASTQPEFGTVRSIDVVEARQSATGGGAVLGALVGGVVAHDIGRGFGRDAATAVGAVGGALFGNELEKNVDEAHSGTRYRVTVGLDDGEVRGIDLRVPEGIYVGERVRVVGQTLSPT